MKPGHILQRRCPLFFFLWCPTTAQLCDSQRILKATRRLPADRSCSRSSEQLFWTASLHKRLKTDRAVVGFQGKTRGHFLHKLWPGFTSVAVLCDILTCIVKFCFSKPWVAVTLTQCCFEACCNRVKKNLPLMLITGQIGKKCVTAGSVKHGGLCHLTGDPQPKV